ncbi:unnamed protein product [Calypogeia fissa]
MEIMVKRIVQLSLLLLLMQGTFSSAKERGGILLIEDVMEQKAPAANAAVPAIFVLGDSVLDAGTNTYFPSLLQADFKPYGTQYFGKPTGRWTNGRTIADFFATYIGLDFIEPYMKRKGKSSIITGVNYASAGCGLLRTTNGANRVIPFPDQILQFGQTKTQIEQTLKSKQAAKELFSRSLFLINIGGNDMFGYIVNQSVPLQVYVDGLLVILKASFEVLYEAGARKVMFLATGPLGCVPGALAPAGITSGQCVQSWSAIGQAYNAALEQFVYTLHESFPDVKAIVGTPYKLMDDLITNGEKYGFTAGVTACCGSGLYNAAVQCGRPADLITNPETNLCDDVDKHVFWDFYHATERVYEMLAKEFWSGNSSMVSPVNLSTLVSC